MRISSILLNASSNNTMQPTEWSLIVFFLNSSKLAAIINAEDCIVLNVDDERFQEVNRKIALDRIENRIVQALVVPKKRKPTKPTKASKERKLKLKKICSEIKKGRAKVSLY